MSKIMNSLYTGLCSVFLLGAATPYSPTKSTTTSIYRSNPANPNVKEINCKGLLSRALRDKGNVEDLKTAFGCYTKAISESSPSVDSILGRRLAAIELRDSGESRSDEENFALDYVIEKGKGDVAALAAMKHKKELDATKGSLEPVVPIVDYDKLAVQLGYEMGRPLFVFPKASRDYFAERFSQTPEDKRRRREEALSTLEGKCKTECLSDVFVSVNNDSDVNTGFEGIYDKYLRMIDSLRRESEQ